MRKAAHNCTMRSAAKISSLSIVIYAALVGAFVLNNLNNNVQS